MSDMHTLFSYLYYYAEVMRATADDASPTPGYLLHQIAGLTLTSEEGQTAKLVDFLLSRLKNSSSPTVKLKTLRLLLYCTRHGSAEFGRLLRMRDGDVTAGSAVSGQPDPLLGMTPYLWVRSTAQELLVLLFSAPADDVTPPPPRHLIGLGSSVTSRGQYQGFGVSTPQPRGLAARVRGLVEQAVWSSPPPSAQSHTPSSPVAGAGGQYEPPARLSVRVDGPEMPQQARVVPSLPAPPSASRGHIPGRAGGGWEDSDSEGEGESGTEWTNGVVLGRDIAADLPESDSPAEPASSPAVQQIRCFCAGDRSDGVSVVDAFELTERLAPYDDVTFELGQQLMSDSDVTRLRALVLLECVLQAWPADRTAALAETVGSLSRATESEMVRVKAVKVGKIMERLSEIIS